MFRRVAVAVVVILCLFALFTQSASAGFVEKPPKIVSFLKEHGVIGDKPHYQGWCGKGAGVCSCEEFSNNCMCCNKADDCSGCCDKCAVN